MATAGNDAASIVRRYWDEVWNRADLNAAQEILPPGYYQREVPFIQKVHAAFPDTTHVINEMIVAGDTVVIRFTWSGTQLGALGGVAPTGKLVKTTGIFIHRIDNGKLADDADGGVVDWLSFWQQLGVVPSDLPW
jgi:predicted ester cyclase